MERPVSAAARASTTRPFRQEALYNGYADTAPLPARSQFQWCFFPRPVWQQGPGQSISTVQFRTCRSPVQSFVFAPLNAIINYSPLNYYAFLELDHLEFAHRTPDRQGLGSEVSPTSEIRALLPAKRAAAESRRSTTPATQVLRTHNNDGLYPTIGSVRIRQSRLK